MFRRAPAGEARYGEVEAAPEEVDGAGLAHEVRAEDLKGVVRARERSPEAVGVLAVVCAVLLVLLEGHRVRDFDGRRPDFRPDAQLVQTRLDLGVELGHRVDAR